MLQRLKSLRIVRSFSILTGNTRVSVLCEPLWGIPFTLYYFYFSLYLKEMGITEQQFGIIIAVGFISSAFFSFFGGIITDYLGRKKTTLYFDIIGWPIALLIYLISRSLPMFLFATVVNNINKIVNVSWNLMVIEDADSDQRKAAFNLLNIINISLGIITPLAGLVVAKYGIIKAERFFIVFAMLSMSIMIYIRNKGYVETKVGQQILNEHRGLAFKDVLKKGLFGGAIKQVYQNKSLRIAFIINILFNLTLPLGAFNSMYFAPFMTDVLGIDKAAVSILGGVYAGVMLILFLAVTPAVSKKQMPFSILAGLLLQVIALIAITLLPKGVMLYAIIAVAVYSFGYGIHMPFFSTLVADVSEGRERAGIYSLINTITSIISAAIGFSSGYLYAANPRSVFYITAVLLVLCFIGMVRFISINKEQKSQSE